MSLILLPKRIFTTIEHLRYRWIGEPRQCRFNAARNRRIGYRDLDAEKARSGSKRSFGMFRIEKMSGGGIGWIVEHDHRRQQFDWNV